MFSTTTVALPRLVGLSAASLLLLITACDQGHLSLPVAQAAAESPAQVTEPAKPAAAPAPVSRRVALDQRERLEKLETIDKRFLDIQRTTEEVYKSLPSQSCYGYMLRRPRAQRADAVQARLKQADQMSAALDSDIFNVDLQGDHANILALDFPVVWPAMPTYSEKVSSVIVDYLSVPEIQDYLCNSGFSEVKLSARDLNDGRSHLLWTAKVTSEGLIKLTADGKRERLGELISNTTE